MTTLLYADHNGQSLAPQTARALTAALKIDPCVDILICGNNIAAICDDAAKLAGVRKVLKAEADSLFHQLAEPVSQTIVSLAPQYDVIISAASANGKNIMPRVAAQLDVMQISDIVDVVSADTYKRPIYTGNAIATVQSLDDKKVITVRATAFLPAAVGGNAEIMAIKPAAIPAMAEFTGEDLIESDMPELTNAKTVIAGGRALGSSEQFTSVLMPLAKKLKAAIGASRAAVDAGYAPNDWQIGQTGKVIAPDLYIAIGISGAIQHVAGVKDSGFIVAINKDSEAPIMKIADVSLVGDLFTVVPELVKAL